MADITYKGEIHGAYYDMKAFRGRRLSEIRISVPVAGALRLSLGWLVNCFPATIRQLLWWHDSLRLACYVEQSICRATLVLGSETFRCQCRDGHVGEHMHSMKGWDRLPYDIRWPGYYEERDADDDRRPPRRYQRKTFP